MEAHSSGDNLITLALKDGKIALFVQSARISKATVQLAMARWIWVKISGAIEIFATSN